MTNERKYPALYQLLAPYFASYWHELYIWDDKEPNYRDIIELFITENTQESILATIEDMNKLLSQNYSDNEVGDILRSHGSNFRPMGVNLTNKQWVENVLEILTNSVQDINPPKHSDK